MRLKGQTPETVLPNIRPEWEYKTVTTAKDDPNLLSQLGNLGWELISVTPAGDSQATFYFRRRK